MSNSSPTQRWKQHKNTSAQQWQRPNSGGEVKKNIYGENPIACNGGQVLCLCLTSVINPQLFPVFMEVSINVLLVSSALKTVCPFFFLPIVRWKVCVSTEKCVNVKGALQAHTTTVTWVHQQFKEPPDGPNA